VIAADWFEKSFGAPLPFALGELAQTPDATHWATALVPQLSARALVIPAFPDEPSSYTVIGHWGSGLGSQAFYFVRREPQHRCFLRIGWGGAWDDTTAEQIVAALDEWRALRDDVAGSEVVYSLGTGHARIDVGGPTITLDAGAMIEGAGGRSPRADELLRRARDLATDSGRAV
jgi:hypothetical protein